MTTAITQPGLDLCPNSLRPTLVFLVPRPLVHFTSSLNRFFTVHCHMFTALVSQITSSPPISSPKSHAS